MPISYEHNFHGVVKVKIGKCRAIPRDAENPDFYTRKIELFDKDGNRIPIHLYGDNISFENSPDTKAREISIEMGE